VSAPITVSRVVIAASFNRKSARVNLHRMVSVPSSELQDRLVPPQGVVSPEQSPAPRAHVADHGYVAVMLIEVLEPGER
jgi:hypothetical protein